MNIRTLAPALALALAACTAQDQTPDTAATTGTTPAATATTAATTATAAAETTTPAPSTGAQMDTFAMPANLLTTPSGLQYSIDRAGTGPQPTAGQTVTVHYSGWLTDGTPFDSSRERGTPFEFPIGAGRVIQGWEEGILAMKVGEKRTLVIPASLGYGERGRGPIPPNATLVFKVELLGTR